MNLIYTTEYHGRTPVLYQPRMIVILQGHKVGYLADQVFRYDPNHYLLMTLPLIMWWTGMGWVEALIADIGLAIAYTAYAFLFNLGYDRVFPIPLARDAAGQQLAAER